MSHIDVPESAWVRYRHVAKRFIEERWTARAEDELTRLLVEAYVEGTVDELFRARALAGGKVMR